MARSKNPVWSRYIRTAREARKWTQEALAERADAWARANGLDTGVSQANIQDIEGNGSHTALEKVQAIVAVLDLDWTDTALAYLGIDPYDAGVREWKPPAWTVNEQYRMLFDRQPTEVEMRHLIDLLETIRFWREAPDEVGHMRLARRARRPSAAKGT